MDKKKAVEQIAAELKLASKHLANANKIAEKAGLNYDLNDGWDGDITDEEAEEFDPDGVMYDLAGWNSSSC